MIIKNILKCKYNTEPLLSSFSDTDKDNVQIMIGENPNNFFEHVFVSENYPKLLVLLCKIIPIKRFEKKVMIYGEGQYVPLDKARFQIYDGTTINLNNFISGIDLEFYDFNPLYMTDDTVPVEWKGYFEECPKIFSMKFQTQEKSCNVKTFKIDRNLSSQLFPFAGYFGNGVQPKDIQQHFFFISINARENFAKTISPKDIVNTKAGLAADTLIQASQVKSLEDIIVEGEVKLSLPTESDLPVQYESVAIQRHTFTSNVIELYFKLSN